MRPPVEPGQYTSVLYSERLASHGIAPSIGSVGDAFDNAMAESGIGLYKTEPIRRRGPWRKVDQVEIETWNTSIGSTTAGCTVRSGTCHRPSSRRCSTLPVKRRESKAESLYRTQGGSEGRSGLVSVGVRLTED